MKESLNIAVFHCGFAYSGGGERRVLEEFVGLRGLELNHASVQLTEPRRLVEAALLEAIPACADRRPLNIVQSAADMVEHVVADMSSASHLNQHASMQRGSLGSWI